MSRDPKRNSAQPASRVSIARARGDFRVVALEAIAEGERVLHFHGELVEHPTRETLQIDTLRHLAVPKGLGVERVLDEYAWRFLNHSCDANGIVRHRELVARRPIEAGDQITFNYNTSEWDMTEVFPCRCDAPDCTGETVRGFRYLSAEEKEALRPHLSGHLLRRLDGDE